jgi:hypothetical protein
VGRQAPVRGRSAHQCQWRHGPQRELTAAGPVWQRREVRGSQTSVERRVYVA